MMKIRNGFCILVAFLFSVTIFSGCQLAQETVSESKKADQLCGVFVTFGFPNLPMNHSSIDDLSVNENGEVSINTERLDTNAMVDGTVYEDGTANFEGFEGYYLGLYHILGDQGEIESSGLVASEGFQDVKSSFKNMAEVQEEICEATLYVATGFNDVFYLNPVYRREDGSYYTLIGQQIGSMFNGSEGNQRCSQSLDNSFSKTIDGVTKTEKISFKVTISAVTEVQQIYIKEMNQNDELIKTTEYLNNKNNTPDQYVVDSNTEYVIVEEYTDSLSDSNRLIRNIYSLTKNSPDEAASHYCCFSGDNGIISRKELQFVYE